MYGKQIWRTIGMPLIALAALLTSLSTYAQKEDRAVAAGGYDPWLEIEGKLGTDRSLGRAELFVPFATTDSGFFFLDLRGVLSDDDTEEGNFGVGYRHMMENYFIGGYVFYDVLSSQHENTFHQITVGVEVVSREWEFRINGYFPISDEKKVDTIAVLDADAVISGQSISLFGDALVLKEEALTGVDAELGYTVYGADFAPESPLASWDFRFIVGYFYFDADESQDDIDGPKGRIEARWHDPFGMKDWQFVLGVEGRDDDVRDTEGFVTAKIHIPLGPVFGGGAGPALGTLQHRMLLPVERDVDIVTADYLDVDSFSTVARNYWLDIIDGVVWFTNGGTGDGTIDDPTNVWDATNGGANFADGETKLIVGLEANNGDIEIDDAYPGGDETDIIKLQYGAVLAGANPIADLVLYGIEDGIVFQTNAFIPVTHDYAGPIDSPAIFGADGDEYLIQVYDNNTINGFDLHNAHSAIFNHGNLDGSESDVLVSNMPNSIWDVDYGLSFEDTFGEVLVWNVHFEDIDEAAIGLYNFAGYFEAIDVVVENSNGNGIEIENPFDLSPDTRFGNRITGVVLNSVFDNVDAGIDIDNVGDNDAGVPYAGAVDLYIGMTAFEDSDEGIEIDDIEADSDIDLTIVDSIFANLGDGIDIDDVDSDVGVEGDTGATIDISIFTTLFDDIDDSGIELDDVFDAIVTINIVDSTFDEMDTAVDADDFDDAQFTLNIWDSLFNNIDDDAIHIEDFDEDIDGVSVVDVFVSGSTFDDIGDDGIRLRDIEGQIILLVTGSTFSDIDEDAIQVDDSENFSGDAGNSYTVVNSIFEEIHGSAIKLEDLDGLNFITITGNTIDDTEDDDAIDIESTEGDWDFNAFVIDISNNTINDLFGDWWNAAIDIELDANSVNLTIVNNTLTDLAGAGLDIEIEGDFDPEELDVRTAVINISGNVIDTYGQDDEANGIKLEIDDYDTVTVAMDGNSLSDNENEDDHAIEIDVTEVDHLEFTISNSIADHVGENALDVWLEEISTGFFVVDNFQATDFEETGIDIRGDELGTEESWFLISVANSNLVSDDAGADRGVVIEVEDSWINVDVTNTLVDVTNSDEDAFTIEFENSDFTLDFVGNTALNAGDHGLELDVESSEGTVAISDFTAIGFGDHGIDLWAEDSDLTLTIDLSLFDGDGSGDDGVKLNDDNSTVDVTITNSHFEDLWDGIDNELGGGDDTTAFEVLGSENTFTDVNDPIDE